MGPYAFRRFEFHPREHRGESIGNDLVLQGQLHARSRLPGGAPTDLIHYHEKRAIALRHHRFHVLRCTQFLKAKAGEFLPHRLHLHGVVSQDVLSFRFVRLTSDGLHPAAG